MAEEAQQGPPNDEAPGHPSTNPDAGMLPRYFRDGVVDLIWWLHHNRDKIAVSRQTVRDLKWLVGWVNDGERAAAGEEGAG